MLNIEDQNNFIMREYICSYDGCEAWFLMSKYSGFPVSEVSCPKCGSPCEVNGDFNIKNIEIEYAE